MARVKPDSDSLFHIVFPIKKMSNYLNALNNIQIAIYAIFMVTAAYLMSNYQVFLNASNHLSLIVLVICSMCAGFLVKAFIQYKKITKSKITPQQLQAHICQALEAQAGKLQEMTEKYEQAQLKIEHANSAKSEFLANINHELRTPLNAIIGFSEIMNSQVFGELGSKKYEEYSRDIHQSGIFLRSIIDDILDMSKIEAGTYRLNAEPCHLGALIDQSLKALKKEAETKNIEFQCDINPPLEVYADRCALHQSIYNILSNAVKFTPHYGHVALRVRSVKNTLIMTVADSGIGMSQKILKRVVQPFEQAQSQFTKNHKGSGLGLSIARSLIEMHQGSLKIISREEIGTIVSIRIPKAALKKPDTEAKIYNRAA